VPISQEARAEATSGARDPEAHADQVQADALRLAGHQRVVAHGVLVDHNHNLDVDPDTGEVLACPEGCPFEQVGLDELTTLLIQASLPPAFKRPPAVAIDGTDIESHTRPHKKRVDADGRSFWSADQEARWGHRTATDRRPTEHFLGYEAHLATYAPRVGSEPIPQVVAGLALRPGIRDRARACLNIVDALPPFDDLLVDRGYTTAKGSQLAGPLRDRHITVTMDLHKTQRVVRPGPEAGTVWVDGSLYTSALPETHRTLEAPTAGMTAAEKARRREAFDAREPYRFVPHAKRDTKRGTQRFRGPAVDAHPFKVRCPNTPASMRMPHTIPTTTCAPGEPCGCGKTITIHDSELERDRQHHPWQSTRWALVVQPAHPRRRTHRHQPLPTPQRQPRLLPTDRPRRYRPADGRHPDRSQPRQPPRLAHHTRAT